ncbi:MAG: bifunctional UDP-N-acetylmuramoyl-tripeptide:D-alanyl-D-alanine ligase/alanine racemase [Bacteroidota bacterium]
MLGTPYTIQEIAEAALAKDLHQGFWPLPKLRYVAYDSRTISHGTETLFIALTTANRDGHAFIQDAYDKGVRHFMVDRPLDLPQVNYILCDVPLEALQRWAMYHRQRFAYPVVGITGSNGKTIVKEWIATLLESQYEIVKSPMSYNSQLGVPLSLLRMHPQADIALIEAGISEAGDMAGLWPMIQPTMGVLTHMGSAHAEGFSSFDEKLTEKLQLFEGTEMVCLGSGQEEVMETIRPFGFSLQTVGEQEADDLVLIKDEGVWDKKSGQQARLSWPEGGAAARENAALALLVALKLGGDWPDLISRMAWLRPVEMRVEMITDNPEVILINDSYNSDTESVYHAMQLLRQTGTHDKRQLILTDIPHLGEQQASVQREVLAEATRLFGKEQVYAVGPTFCQLTSFQSYPDTAQLRDAIQYADFQHSTVLLKGARAFALEQLIPLLNPTLNASWFQIDLQALGENYRLLKAKLPTETKTMCMVKAASYGSGTWEIAEELEKAGATYLTVAYASEGIALRKARIELPIMVMNPALHSIEALLQYDLEPEVSNFDFLERFVRAARLAGKRSYPIHLKLETGMGRLGFAEADIPELIRRIQQFPDIQVLTVLTHLAAADDAREDAFSLEQIHRYQAMYAQLREALGLQAFRHVLNTAGLLRFPNYTLDMVRLGIGLYGIDPIEGEKSSLGLQEIGSLHAAISQIREYPAGVSIGYGRAQRTERLSRIATLPIGYADGIPRAGGNGVLSFLLKGKRVPTFGRICMDMLMLDVTDVPDARAGDEVVIFGRQGEAFLSVQEMARKVDTIPYEILVRISPRVRRVFAR